MHPSTSHFEALLKVLCGVFDHYGELFLRLGPCYVCIPCKHTWMHMNACMHIGKVTHSTADGFYSSDIQLVAVICHKT